MTIRWIFLIVVYCLVKIVCVRDVYAATVAVQPDSEKTVLDILVEDDRFETLAAAMQEAGLAVDGTADGPITLFAPPTTPSTVSPATNWIGCGPIAKRCMPCCWYT